MASVSLLQSAKLCRISLVSAVSASQQPPTLFSHVPRVSFVYRIHMANFGNFMHSPHVLDAGNPYWMRKLGAMIRGDDSSLELENPCTQQSLLEPSSAIPSSTLNEAPYLNAAGLVSDRALSSDDDEEGCSELQKIANDISAAKPILRIPNPIKKIAPFFLAPMPLSAPFIKNPTMLYDSKEDF